MKLDPTEESCFVGLDPCQLAPTLIAGLINDKCDKCGCDIVYSAKVYLKAHYKYVVKEQRMHTLCQRCAQPWFVGVVQGKAALEGTAKTLELYQPAMQQARFAYNHRN